MLNLVKQDAIGVAHEDADAGIDRQVEALVEKAWSEGTEAVAPRLLREALDYVIASLDAGRLRVANREASSWRPPWRCSLL